MPTNNSFTIEVGEANIKIVDPQFKDNQLMIKNMGIADIDPLFYTSESENIIDKTAKTIKNLVKQLKITKKNVRFVIPDAFSYNNFIEMPDVNEKELLSSIKYQADQFIPLPLDQVNLDIEIVFKNPKTKKLLALLSAAPKKVVEKITNLTTSLSLISDSLETETSATARFVNNMLRTSGKDTTNNSGFVIINMGLVSSSIYYILETPSLMVYSHNFKMGFNIFSKELQINMNIDSKKSSDLLKHIGLSKSSSYNIQKILTPSIKSFADYVEASINDITKKHNLKINNIYLLNESINVRAIDEFVGRYFSIPTSYLNIYNLLPNNNVVNYFKDKLGYFIPTIGASL
ncbi:MAG: pilus assembly protein PilM [Patescibacteria group bacterium]